MIRSSVEYHEYNYPKIIQSKPKDQVRASTVGDDGYLIAEPGIQGLPNPGSKVYYSFPLPISQSKSETETPPTPKKLSLLFFPFTYPSPPGWKWLFNLSWPQILLCTHIWDCSWRKPGAFYGPCGPKIVLFNELTPFGKSKLGTVLGKR